MTLSFRPVYYLGQVAYYELNIDYIIQTYCVNVDKPELQCNGKCHLAKQLQLETDTNQDSDLNALTVIEGFFPIFNQERSYIIPENTDYFILNKPVDFYNKRYNHSAIFSQFKPPQVLI